MGLLGLPAIPADLRAVQPYLQRADELKAKDPIMAYWCAFYAAQVGISSKSKDPMGRELLRALLTKLEAMKDEAGPSDAIDQEAASSAYVESFGLKVFSMADNEDRQGGATRSTAKKFLAAANFLEVLKIFPTSELSDTNDDKIRYAKWKAADIAKAFREGRKPIPGPAGSQDPELTPQSFASTLPSPPSIDANNSPSAAHNTVLPETKTHHRRGSSASPPKSLPLGNSALGPDTIPATPPRKPNGKHLTVTGGWGTELNPNSPGTWSTAATPGVTPLPTPANQPEFTHPEQGSPSKRAKRRKENGSDASGSDGSDSSGGSLKPSLKYQSNGNANAEALGLGASKSVRWTESVEGGLSTVDGSSPPASPGEDSHAYPSSFGALPPGFVPGTAYPTFNAQPSASSPPKIYANTPSPPQYNTPINPSVPQIYGPPSASAAPQAPQIYAPSAPPAQPPSASPQIYTPKPPSPPQIYAQPKQVELTPAVVTQIRRHCRFAMSSLDYEDIEETKRQLREALRILGD